MKKLTYQYRWLSITVLVLVGCIACGVIGSAWYKQSLDSASVKDGTLLYNAMSKPEGGKLEFVEQALRDVIKSRSSNYQYIAKIRLASLLANTKPQEASDIYISLARDLNAPVELRELVVYMNNILSIHNVAIQAETIGNGKVYGFSINSLNALRKLNQDFINGKSDDVALQISALTGDFGAPAALRRNNEVLSKALAYSSSTTGK